MFAFQSREARKHEQQNNPHYLKGSNSTQTNNHSNGEAIDNIPVTELNLNVQLKVAGQKRSDKYLISNVEKKKSKKKSKKKKHRSERYVG